MRDLRARPFRARDASSSHSRGAAGWHTADGCSFDETDPYARDRSPDFGLYLDDCWRPPWAHERVAWPDFGVPDDPAQFLVALRDLLDRARDGQQVEIGCVGGHGRTGTAVACLAILSGHAVSGAVSWVRDHYCPKAVETDEQAVFVATLSF